MFTIENLPLSDSLEGILKEAIKLCDTHRNEFLTPEHLITVMLDHPRVASVLEGPLGAYLPEFELLNRHIKAYVAHLESVPEEFGEYEISESDGMARLGAVMEMLLHTSSVKCFGVAHVIHAFEWLDDLYGPSIINRYVEPRHGEILSRLTDEFSDKEERTHSPYSSSNSLMDDEDIFGELSKPTSWKDLVVCVNDTLDDRNPLIGREAELERTIQVLSRKDKNNPLHIGEPGVGKTALVYGLARMIEEGHVPERLKGRKIYRLDVGSLLAGAQYRGQFEERLKMVMEGMKSEPGSICYIDEIHTIVGAGTSADQGVDAANQLKPYLESGDIRFIGSTTYEEFNRRISKSKSLVRRFQQIDILEPSEAEAIEILRQLQPIYEKFHGIEYTDEAVEFAVRGTSRHIADRRLPDKAIDLIDEAGAYLELHPRKDGSKIVDEELIRRILAKICRIETSAVEKKDEAEELRTLTDRVLGRVFGQDEAVRGVTEAVMMSKAGLTDPTKPIASMLFVGPTGVGKTEVALALADAMGVGLVRFDMSEYAEKHTVAKLIGAPAGYVGYDDGGLLTDAVRKTPNCVLLLDEIEKAHPDIYNILLQVMDYGRLTDSKGQQADFRNVVIVMTSNAGAQHASRASVGFGSNVTPASAMAREVKRLFKPEFLNRLSAMVTFNGLDREMGERILTKKLHQLESQLAERKVTLNLSEEVRAKLLDEGVTRDHGARELDRVIASRLKPLLMREILFGTLRDGGIANVLLASDGTLYLQDNHISPSE